MISFLCFPTNPRSKYVTKLFYMNYGVNVLLKDMLMALLCLMLHQDVKDMFICELLMKSILVLLGLTKCYLVSSYRTFLNKS